MYFVQCAPLKVEPARSECRSRNVLVTTQNITAACQEAGPELRGTPSSKILGFVLSVLDDMTSNTDGLFLFAIVLLTWALGFARSCPSNANDWFPGVIVAGA